MHNFRGGMPYLFSDANQDNRSLNLIFSSSIKRFLKEWTRLTDTCDTIYALGLFRMTDFKKLRQCSSDSEKNI